MEGVKLKFKEAALFAIAKEALRQKTGARGLRAILESVMLDVMFELPSRKDVSKCAITKETIEKGVKPTLVTSAGAELEDEEERAAESA
jgi:ATP-dependent Clp protease ATP-binding subunit ClpX